ncbi:MAG: AtpZ/AtpI family protein [Acidobacteriota bacterium]
MRGEGRPKPTRQRSYAAGLARYSSIIMVLPASMAAGWMMGYYLLDRWLHIFPWGSITFTFIGAGAGFYEIFKILAPESDKNDRSSGGGA